MNPDRIIAVRNSKTVYRDGEYCLKVFGNSYSKADIFAEALNLALVEETGLPIPKLHEVTRMNGKWTIVTDYIKGKSLAQLMREDFSKKDEYINRFVDLQLEVFSKVCPRLPKMRDKMNQKIAMTDFDGETKTKLFAMFDTLPEHEKLCHGDFNPSNIIVTDDGTPYILDWSHATRGNASADVARSYLCFWLAGDIDGAERYLKKFCEKSNTEKRYIENWMPLVASAQTVKSNEREREFLHSWVKF